GAGTPVDRVVSTSPSINGDALLWPKHIVAFGPDEYAPVPRRFATRFFFGDFRFGVEDRPFFGRRFAPFHRVRFVPELVFDLDADRVRAYQLGIGELDDPAQKPATRVRGRFAMARL